MTLTTALLDPGAVRAPAPRCCRHCGQPLPGAAPAVAADPPIAFCCPGCAAAYQLLQDAGLGGFYTLLPAPEASTGASLRPAPEPEVVGRWDHLVLPARDGGATVRWQVGGIHCLACLWLLERLPRLVEGVRASRLDLGSEQLLVIFDPARTTPDRIARAITGIGYRLAVPGERLPARQAARRAALTRVAVAGASAIGTMHLALMVAAGDLTHDLGAAGRQWFAVLGGIVAAPALLYSGAPWWRSAWAHARLGRVSPDTGPCLVLAVASVASVVGVVTGGDLYWDAACMYLLLLLGGRLVLQAIRDRAFAALPLSPLLPPGARRLGSDQLIPSAQLQPGEMIEVRAGEAVPADGIAHDEAVVDAAVITGESLPVTLAPGARCWAGSILRSPRLLLTVRAVGAGTRIGQILDQAGAARPQREDGERLLTGMVALTLLAAVLVAVLAAHVGEGGAVRRGVAVLMVSCPCALGLALPLLSAIALRVLAQRGIVVRDPDALLRLRQVRTALLDKTGTLTGGAVAVTAWHQAASSALGDERLRGAVRAACAQAQHPVALALATCLAETAPVPVAHLEEIVGAGLRCRVQDAAGAWHALAIGGHRLLTALASGETGIAEDGRIVARVIVSDPLRADAPALVAALEARGLRVGILSGDARAPVAAAATALHLDGPVHADCDPEAKAAQVRAAAPALMVGDGLNDALALGAAAVGIAVRGGLAALDACDIVLVGAAAEARADAIAALGAVADGLARARRQQVAVMWWWNAVAIAAVAAGLIGPWICAIAMPISSCTAVLLAARQGSRWRRGG